jgi:hypothetical protein
VKNQAVKIFTFRAFGGGRSPPNGGEAAVDSPSANRQTRVLQRDCEKSAGFGNGNVENQSELRICTSEFLTIP